MKYSYLYIGLLDAPQFERRDDLVDRPYEEPRGDNVDPPDTGPAYDLLAEPPFKNIFKY